jgi:hypothetical protein
MSKKETALMLATITGTIGTIGGIERSNHLSSELNTAKTELATAEANQGKTASQVFEAKWLKGPDSVREFAKKATQAEQSDVMEEIQQNWENVAVDRPELNKQTEELINILDNLDRLDGSEANKYMRLKSSIQDQLDKIVINFKPYSAQDEGSFAKHQTNLDDLQKIVDKVSQNLKLGSLKDSTKIPDWV